MLLRSFTVIFFSSCIFIVSCEYESQNNLAGNFIANFEEDYRHIEQFSENDADAFTFAQNHGQNIYDRFDGFVSKMARSSRVKRTATAKQDSSSYILTGFIENGTIPVNFPRDICLIDIQGVTYAAALHLVTEANENKTLFTIFQKQKTDDEFKAIYTTETRSATCMDCIALGAYGYIAVVYTIKNSTTNVAGDGSPIFQIRQRTRNDVVEAAVQIVQYFTEPHQNRVYLRQYGNNIFLLQSFLNPMHYGLGTNANCQIYKWSGYNFDVIDELPCSNAMRIEPFLIGSDIYIVIANYMDVYDEIETFSFVYKFNVEHMAYMLTQKLRTYAAVDAKYFHLEENGELEHFLVVANSHERRTENGTSTENFEMNSIIYKFVNGYFTPFQTILLYDIIQFLPVLTAKKEFILLISCNNQDTKVWQYNGWTFFESEVQFTGGALGKGVSNMRRYPWADSSVLVVANSNMLSDDTSLYIPVFNQRLDSKYMRTGTDGRSWCTDTMTHLQTQNLDSLSSELGIAPKNSDSTVSLEHSITFEQLTAKTVTTKSLKTKSMTLNQKLADQLNVAQKIIEKLDKQLNRLDNHLKQSNLPQQEAITSETPPVADITIVPLPLESAAQTSLNVPYNYASHQDLDHLNVNELTVDFLNGNPISQLLYADRDLNIRSLVADKLYVNSTQTYKQLEEQAVDLQVQASAPTEHIEFSEVTDTISADSLVVNGTINQLDIGIIKQFALKTEATEQNIQGNFNFGKLRAYGVFAKSSLVSGRNLSDIIRTEGGTYFVSQDVRFDEPLQVDRLYVNERINNLRVQNGRFDVLLKNSNETQTITGHKSFNAVRLLSPIVLHGKINSSNLSSMNPIVSVTNDIVLEGDYEITGTVTIRGQLHGQNLFGSSGMFNVQQLHEEGLPKSASVIDAHIEFAQPIKTESLIVKGTVNSMNVSSFVCDADIHTLTGMKTFAGDLHVKEGFCDALTINGIQMEILNNTVLKRSGDQEVYGKIHFKQIIVNKSSSRSTWLSGKKYSDFLTPTDQSIDEVHVKGDLTIRNAVKIKNLRTMGSLCGQDMTFIMEDTVLLNGPLKPIRGNKTFVGDVTIDGVAVHGNLFQIGTWAEILKNLQSTQNDIVLQGPIKFENRFRLKELIVDGELNGIPGGRFGHLWLLKDSDQDFTEPQEVITLIANELLLNGNINDVRLNGVFENTVWLNESLALKQAIFNQLISDQPLIVPGSIGGIQFPEEVVFSTADSQELMGHLIFDQDVIITGNLAISGSINGIEYNKLCDLIAANSSFGIQVLGEAVFASEPRVDVLNDVSIQAISDTTWFLNENTDITGNLTFGQVDFESNVDLKGLLNSKDLSYIGENYFSLTKPQEVHVNINFGNNVMFEDIMEADEIQLLGVIQDGHSGRSFKIEDFEKHALTKDTNQVVVGRWQFHEATIMGNLYSLVNDLDLSIDVIRYSVPINNVTAPKYFKNVVMKDLKATSTVQEVNIADWFTKATFIEGNYTIQGTTVIENPIFYNNVKVFGLVNNLPFNADSILLKSVNQNIRGNLYVFTKYQADQKILPLSFEHAKLTSINGLHMTEFFANIARLDEKSLKIYSNLTFVEPLMAGSLSTSGKWNGISLVGAIAQLQSNQYASNYTQHLDHLHTVGRSLITNIQNRKLKLVSYQLRQTLPGNINQIVVLNYDVNDESRIVYAIFSRPNPLGVVNFYKWDHKTSAMIIDNDHFALQPKDMYIVDIMSLRIYDHDYLIIETADPHAHGLSKWSFFTYVNKKFRNVHERYNNGTHTNMVGVMLSPGRSCYATYSFYDSRVVLSCARHGDLSGLQFEPFIEFDTASPIVQVVAAAEVECSELIILDALGTIYVWQLSANETINRFEIHQIIRLIYAARHVATIRYADTMYLVASSEHILNSTHFGSVEVYKSTNGQYEHIQSIPTDLPVQSELTTDAATQELVLYILTGNSVRPLIAYRFAGVDGFRQFFVATTLPPSRSFNLLFYNKPLLINDEERRMTLITALAKETHGAYIIEPIVN